MIEHGKKKKKRFAAKDGAVAAFVKPKNCHYTNLGQIVEMNMEGLSLKYLSREEGHLQGESVMLDIFGIGRPLLGAGKVECRVVNDIPLTDHYSNSLNTGFAPSSLSRCHGSRNTASGISSMSMPCGNRDRPTDHVVPTFF